MSDHPKVQDTMKHSISRLDDQTKYEEWRDQIMNYFQNRYTTAWSHLEHDTDPTYAFQLPMLEYLAKVARKATTAVSGYRYLNSEEASLPLIRESDEEFSSFKFDSQDGHFYYRMTRSDEYPGTYGQRIWEMECNNILRLKSEYHNKTKAQVWADLERFISDTILAKVKIPIEEYKTRKADLDYKWLYDQIKLVHTGEGEASLALKLSEVLNMRFMDVDLNTYNSGMVNAREDIARMKVDPETLIEQLFSVTYHIGLTRFANTNPTVNHALNLVFEKQEWPTMDATMSGLTTATTLRERLNSQNNTFGILRANESNLQANLAKQKPSSHSKTPFYKGLSIGGMDKSKPLSKLTMCFGC